MPFDIIKFSYDLCPAKYASFLVLKPNLDYQFNFRSVDKSKWVSKYDFNPYS